jgi:hypothetical protein
MARGSVALQAPRPHGGAVVHDGSSVGAEGLKCFKKFYFILFYFYFIFKKIQPPRPHGEAVMHDGSSVGAGGLKCFKKF